MADVVAERREERDRLIGLAREYAVRLSAALPIEVATVIGSVARGDFNVWSDVDVLVVSEALPSRTLDRIAFLSADAPPRVQPIGLRRNEFQDELERGNPIAREAVERGVVLVGGLPPAGG